MRMSEKYLLKVLTDILVSTGCATEKLLTDLFALFRGRAIIVPNPGYGEIVHDLPDDYAFPGMTKLFEAKFDGFCQYFKENLEPFFHHELLRSIPSEQVNEQDFYWKNVYYPEGDARTLYAMLAHLKPSKMIEVGVGNSTKMARKAINDFSLGTKIISIDPTPRADIHGFTDVHLQQSVTDVDLKCFDVLKSGDILFIDGSHVSHCGTDVPHFALNILPRLRPGVYVHIHDIFLPWEYHEDFRIRHYNEQHVFGALITCENCWETVFPVHYMQRKGAIPFGGGALWIRKQ